MSTKWLHLFPNVNKSIARSSQPFVTLSLLFGNQHIINFETSGLCFWLAFNHQRNLMMVFTFIAIHRPYSIDRLYLCDWWNEKKKTKTWFFSRKTSEYTVDLLRSLPFSIFPVTSIYQEHKMRVPSYAYRKFISLFSVK